MKLRILITACLALLALPASAQACTTSLDSQVDIVPSNKVAEGQTQTVRFSASPCTSQPYITVEWVRVLSASSYLTNPSARQTIIAEYSAAPAGATSGSAGWTLALGTADGRYASITRLYDSASSSSPSQVSGSQFDVYTVDECMNMPGKQQTVPATYAHYGPGTPCLPDMCLNYAGFQHPEPIGYVSSAQRECTIIPYDACPALEGFQPEVTECPLLASPTGTSPTPIGNTSPWISTKAMRTFATSGSHVTWAIRFGNDGPGALRAARVCDRIPPGTHYVRHTGRATLIGRSICWNAGTVFSGEARRYSLTLRIGGSAPSGKLFNTACLTSASSTRVCSSGAVRIIRGRG